MKRGRTITTTVERVMKVLSRGANAATAAEIRVAVGVGPEPRKDEIRSPFASTVRVRSH
jgi:hypothetical protein